MFDPITGDLSWAVDSAGYEIVDSDDAASSETSSLDANFFRSVREEADYLRRGVVRGKGGGPRCYRPMDEAPGLARRLASMYALDPIDGGLKNHDILEFAGQYGLLIGDQFMRVRDLIYTAKYLSLFAQAVDEGRKPQARQVFNQRVAPHMTVKLVGSKSGKPTANWSLEVEPTDLIAVAWLQMAQELTQDKRLKKCDAPDCLEWFPDRSNKRFCNNRCKMAFHHA